MEGGQHVEPGYVLGTAQLDSRLNGILDFIAHTSTVHTSRNPFPFDQILELFKIRRDSVVHV